MRRKQELLRNRYLIFTRTDEIAFSRALQEAFGSVLFYDNGPFGHHMLPIRNRIVDCSNTHIWGFVPEPGWKPVALRDEQFHYDYIKNVPQRFHFYMHRSVWHWVAIPRMAFDDPTLEEGSITSWFDRDDSAEKAFVRKIWRILDKMTCRDYKVEFPHTGRVLGDTISDVRAGHDALRWCSQGKARMLNGLWRPRDDWAFPNLSWYDGLEVGDPPGVCWGGGYGGKTL